MQGYKAIDITVGYHFVYYAAQLGHLVQSGIVALSLFEDQNKVESNKLKIRGNDWKTGQFEICLP